MQMSYIFTSHFMVAYFGVHNCCLEYHSTSWNSVFLILLLCCESQTLYACISANSVIHPCSSDILHNAKLWILKNSQDKKFKKASQGWKALRKWVWPIFISVWNTIQPHTQQTWMTINYTNCNRQNVLLHAASVNFTLSVFCQGKQNKPPYTHQSPHPPQNKNTPQNKNIQIVYVWCNDSNHTHVHVFYQKEWCSFTTTHTHKGLTHMWTVSVNGGIVMLSITL